MKLRSLGLLAVVALIAASCGGATPEAAGPNEGIQVHGDWTIDVYNPDGSLDQHREFSNAFVGARPMAAILTRAQSVREWRIEFGSESGSQPCVIELLKPLCLINETTEVFPDSGQSSSNLMVGRGPNDDMVVLSGSFTASAAGEISQVLVNLVGETAGLVYAFTEKSGLSDPDTGLPYQIALGQTIQIQVEISFTSG